ncbi:hypothetical protein ACI7BZ_03835 [Xanthobacter sp. AM11]|uniref:hypothetical protein n=1 Tax=Xanthobacter sp. AM11 TaxID=3380643 RepID=UPI0039BFEC78
MLDVIGAYLGREAAALADAPVLGLLLLLLAGAVGWSLAARRAGRSTGSPGNGRPPSPPDQRAMVSPPPLPQPRPPHLPRSPALAGRDAALRHRLAPVPFTAYAVPAFSLETVTFLDFCAILNDAGWRVETDTVMRTQAGIIPPTDRATARIRLERLGDGLNRAEAAMVEALAAAGLTIESHGISKGLERRARDILARGPVVVLVVFEDDPREPIRTASAPGAAPDRR